MNKKGFTIIELLISISLLAIVLVFMMNALIKLRDTKLAEGKETSLLVGQALIGKTINSDILKAGGITSYLGCDENTLELTLNDGTKRIISIINSGDALNAILKYTIEGKSTDELVRKIPNGYEYDGFSCLNENGLIKIKIKIKDYPVYDTEILYYDEN